MILLDVVDADNQKSDSSQLSASGAPLRTVRHPETYKRSPSSSSLPDYYESQAKEDTNPAAENVKKRFKTGRRFWRNVAIILLVYVVLSIVIAVAVYLTWRHRKNSQQTSKYYTPLNHNQQPFDLSSLPSAYGKPVNCNSWEEGTNHGSESRQFILNYTLPANETIYLQSNFSQTNELGLSPASGTLLVSVSEDSQQSLASISVAMSSILGQGEKPPNACVMQANGGWGLTLYDSEDYTISNYIFDIHLRLPPFSNKSTLRGIETSLPLFNQSFASLDSYRQLDTFSAQGSLGSIHVDSVHAKTIIVQTSAASITGTFNASESLVLETVLAPIYANVSLSSQGVKEYPPTILSVNTGNDDIHVNITLYGGNTADPSDYPAFVTDLKTFSGALQATFSHHETSAPSALWVTAHSNLQPAQVYVDSKFEGTYDVRTSLAEAIVDRTEVEDPSGSNRRRIYVDDHVSRTRATGFAGWDAREAGSETQGQQGHIEVLSSLSPAVLQLTGAPNGNHTTKRAGKRSVG